MRRPQHAGPAGSRPPVPLPTIRTVIEIDLTDAPADRMRHRADQLTTAPPGCSVIVHVGALAVEPTAVRVIAHHAETRRLTVSILGTTDAAPRWTDAVREGVEGLIAQ